MPNTNNAKQYRMEAYDPRKSHRWDALRDIAEDELEAAEQQRNKENRENAPVLVRIVRKTGS